VRTERDSSGPELAQLTQLLDHLRETILLKADGLSREQLAQPLPPSILTLGGLLNHLALVEDTWFRVRFLGLPDSEPWASVDWEADRDWEFHTAADVDPDELRRRYREACDRSRTVVAGAGDLDRLAAAQRRDGRHPDLRWILLHMIEETARHAGHADLIRESIDGSVGD
jgi:uncharacterized damage-inducible protein DinB